MILLCFTLCSVLITAAVPLFSQTSRDMLEPHGGYRVILTNRSFWMAFLFSITALYFLLQGRVKEQFK